MGLLIITRLMERKHRAELTFFDHVVSQLQKDLNIPTNYKGL